jgi:hypothetical protein
MWNDRYSAVGLFDRAVFDPTGGIATGALALAGGAMSAMGTLAGGSSAAAMGAMQRQAAEFQATQDTMNSASDIASAQRQAIDITQKANLLRSSAVASAAAGGVTTTSGSPLTNEAQIAGRGDYASRLALWNGQNAATGDLNKAAAAHYSGLVDEIGGQMQKQASEFTAAGTLASSGASAFKLYGMAGGGYGGASGNIGYGAGVGAYGPIPLS